MLLFLQILCILLVMLDLASTVLIEIADTLQASLRNVTKLPFIPKILLHYKRLVRESRTNPEETAHAIVSLARLLTTKGMKARVILLDTTSMGQQVVWHRKNG